MNNIEKLIASTKINHGGVEAKADNWGCVKKIRQGIQQAQEIAGVVC
jgi:hypothetical protein